MGYQIRKGWPSDHALDETVKAATGQTITEGLIVKVANGLATVAADGDGICGFVIGQDTLVGVYTVLLGDFIVEVDAQHYAAASYAAGDKLTAAAGKFKKAGADEEVIGKVLAVVSGTDKLRILWVA
jgi:hypothetical protein